jgi:pimeloyl-ACP methyl ester carboxylesterase
MSRWSVGVCVFAAVLLSNAFLAAAAETIAVKTATVDGLKLQYMTAGHGPAVVLLHGYAETSRLMVAYAYAAQFPTETEKLALMDAFPDGRAGPLSQHVIADLRLARQRYGSRAAVALVPADQMMPLALV